MFRNLKVHPIRNGIRIVHLTINSQMVPNHQNRFARGLVQLQRIHF